MAKEKKCKNCGKSHKRRKFCSNKCKDEWHNWNNPRGKFAHLNPSDPNYDDREEMHPMDLDGQDFGF